MIYLNGTPVRPTIFPDHTSQVWKLDDALFLPKKSEILWEFENEVEFMHIAQLKMLLDEYGNTTRLSIDYLPYARQDKPVSNNTTFALRSFIHLLDSLDFVSITCLDPHSSFAEISLPNFRAAYPFGELEHVSDITDTHLVCYPDKGAVSKYTKIYNPLVKDDYIYGEKVRDQATGNIIKYDLVTKGIDLTDLNILIVDDICDGGATFTILAKDLLKAGAKSVNLFVTHGIFSKGINTLTKSRIRRIFTAKGEAFHDPDFPENNEIYIKPF